MSRSGRLSAVPTKVAAVAPFGVAVEAVPARLLEGRTGVAMVVHEALTALAGADMSNSDAFDCVGSRLTALRTKLFTDPPPHGLVSLRMLPHTAGPAQLMGVVRVYMDELPLPLVPAEHYELVMKLCEEPASPLRTVKLRTVLATIMSWQGRQLLKAVAQVLAHVWQQSRAVTAKAMMDALGWGLIRPSAEATRDQVRRNRRGRSFVRTLIDEYVHDPTVFAPLDADPVSPYVALAVVSAGNALELGTPLLVVGTPGQLAAREIEGEVRGEDAAGDIHMVAKSDVTLAWESHQPKVVAEAAALAAEAMQQQQRARAASRSKRESISRRRSQRRSVRLSGLPTGRSSEGGGRSAKSSPRRRKKKKLGIEVTAVPMDDMFLVDKSVMDKLSLKLENETMLREALEVRVKELEEQVGKYADVIELLSDRLTVLEDGPLVGSSSSPSLDDSGSVLDLPPVFISSADSGGGGSALLVYYNDAPHTLAVSESDTAGDVVARFVAQHSLPGDAAQYRLYQREVDGEVEAHLRNFEVPLRLVQEWENTGRDRVLQLAAIDELERSEFNTSSAVVRLGDDGNAVLSPAVKRGRASSISAGASKNAKRRSIAERKREAEALKEVARSGPRPGVKVSMDDFDLIKVLGKGTFGKVFLVRKKGSETVYAMKSISKGLIIKQKQVANTIAERHVLQRTDHPFLLHLYYSFQTKDKLYFVFDYVSGGEVFFHLDREVKFDEARVKFYAAELTLALGYLHSLNIAYRDLKPENVLIKSSGHICLADFGLCKENVTSDDELLEMCGTEEYVAPEMILRVGYGMRADWWALGILVYEMLVGEPPFQHDDRKETFRLILHHELPLDPTLFSEQAAAFVGSLLERSPNYRLGGKGGDVDEVTAHPWYADIDFDALLRLEVSPPWVPNVAGDDDTSMFDEEFTSMRVSDSPPLQAHLLAGVMDPFMRRASFDYSAGRTPPIPRGNSPLGKS
ncbi:AGC protein kinase [Thecamonas trahens ATCC 50062]|uniref:non-specific serine/threonine protein kinase n=1 Tax=Thecamonas trahens ATCC 50062 TaxID=461836 RepID=A0A0L0D4B5_THETB|nr:AGC protein kinase [Thecamonas trahens ATCC 50062]KNC46138.1 AGC protein kinase [Thecamonas trahens ATCC 50062]|eukprot:XP_013763115.1 AGC protein kinase [Thecamonas trahens ATCC 50062]